MGAVAHCLEGDSDRNFTTCRRFGQGSPCIWLTKPGPRRESLVPRGIIDPT